MVRSLVTAVLLVASVGCAAGTRDNATPNLAAEGMSAYQGIISQLASRSRLDDDPVLLERLAPIFRRLIQAAGRSYPGSRDWAWELHVTSDPAFSAFCILGGKVLVGSRFVQQLKLDDDELAMLLAHEMSHALAGHLRERAPQGGMEDNLAWENHESAIALRQESEADRLGLSLARDAGFPVAGLLGFFDKLAAAEPAGTFSSTHPSARTRAAQVRAWAAARETGPK